MRSLASGRVAVVLAVRLRSLLMCCRFRRVTCRLVCVFWLWGQAEFPSATAADPLPSWNSGPVKSSLIEFVEKVTTPGSPDFVPVAERIATFDNDGTLWCEQPNYVQAIFVLERLKELAPQHPEWQNQAPFSLVLNPQASVKSPPTEHDFAKLVAVTHAGMTTTEFMSIVEHWLASARHPRFHRLYPQLVYQPMLELLAWLRERDFTIFIVSGGGVEFIRAYAEGSYGIPPQRIIGSSGKTRYEFQQGVPVLLKLPEIGSIDDGVGKPENINLQIGRRPVLAFGNSDGDLQMLEWTTYAPGPRLGLIVHHTDAVREYAYDRESAVGRLDKALDAAPARGWVVVDMQADWKTIFPADAAP